MNDRLAELEDRHNLLVEAVNEVNGNLASVGYSTTESIKGIMEGFQSISIALHEIIQNIASLEKRVEELEKSKNSDFLKDSAN